MYGMSEKDISMGVISPSEYYARQSALPEHCEKLATLLSNDLIIISLVIAFVGLVLAWITETQKSDSNPDRQTYWWGHFIAYNGIVGGIFYFIATYSLGSSCRVNTFPIPLLSLVLIYFSCGVLQKNRIAWVGMSVLLLNPLYWLINYIYCKKHWKEFYSGIPLYVGLKPLFSVLAYPQKRYAQEQHKLLYQNRAACDFLRSYFESDPKHAQEVATIIDAIYQHTKQLAVRAKTNSPIDYKEMMTLHRNNKQLRRLYDFTATSRIDSFDKSFQPLLGWKRYSETFVVE